ncbi:zinc-binding oxidoreductase, partial [Sarocladium strictum]
MSPSNIQQWSVTAQKEDLSGLELQTKPLPEELGPDEVLVELRAASLNYRDIVIAKGLMGLKSIPDLVPGSDGAGVVLRTGTAVKALSPGDRVVTHMVPETSGQLSPLNDDTLPSTPHICAGLGQGLHGTLTTHGVLKESCLAKFGENLTFEEAATLTCSGITAWNAVMGLQSKAVKKDDWVLVQGTGGVSIAALQFALAAGANAIATTSSAQKAERLRALGAHHVINYREVPEWGAAAKKLTPDGRGVDIVVDVGGNATLGQSLAAIRIDGLVVIAGLLGKTDKDQSIMSLLGNICMARGILLGSRNMMRDMIAFIEKHAIKPALDDKVFKLEEVNEAYKRLEAQQHFSKIVIRI